MKNRFSQRIQIHKLAFHKNCYSANRMMVSDIMSRAWTGIIRDKLDPIELIENYGYDERNRIYEQTLYIFTEAELREFIKTNLVIKLKDIDGII